MTFQGYFQIIIFSSVMMHLNWSLPCVHSTKLINCKYVILFVTFPSIYRNFVGISRTWKCLVKCSYQCMKEIFLLKMKTHSLWKSQKAEWKNNGTCCKKITNRMLKHSLQSHHSLVSPNDFRILWKGYTNKVKIKFQFNLFILFYFIIIL